MNITKVVKWGWFETYLLQHIGKFEHCKRLCQLMMAITALRTLGLISFNVMRSTLKSNGLKSGLKLQLSNLQQGFYSWKWNLYLAFICLLPHNGTLEVCLSGIQDMFCLWISFLLANWFALKIKKISSEFFSKDTCNYSDTNHTQGLNIIRV